MRNIGTHYLQIRIVQHNDNHFNRKVVFVNLEEILSNKGVTVRSVETRESGRGTPIATRVLSDYSKALSFSSPVSLVVASHDDSHFNSKITLIGLEEALESQGFKVGTCETRANGPGTPMAIRAKL
jgi:hypothetical protein